MRFAVQDRARAQSVQAHSDAGEPPALHMLPSRFLRQYWNDLERSAGRPHMERGQLARPASGSELCALRRAKRVRTRERRHPAGSPIKLREWLNHSTFTPEERRLPAVSENALE
jgi:hypothetical protein